MLHWRLKVAAGEPFEKTLRLLIDGDHGSTQITLFMDMLNDSQLARLKPVPGPHQVYGFSDDDTERDGRTDPSQGDARYPDDR
jgi:hypothetical protein